MSVSRRSEAAVRRGASVGLRMGTRPDSREHGACRGRRLARSDRWSEEGAMRSATILAAAGVIVALWCATAVAARPTRVTPAGWRVAPAGREIAVSKMAAGFQGPMGAALSPNGRQLLAVSSGASRWESADLFDLRPGARTAAQLYDATLAPRGQSAFYGVAFAPDGGRAWVSGGGQNVVHVLDVTGSTVRAAGDIVAPYFPAGLAYGV